MKSSLTFALMGSFLVATSAQAYSDSDAAQRLGRHLSNIETTAHRARMISGITTLALGTAGAVGFFIARGSSNPDTHDTIAPLLGVAGGIFLLTGTLAVLIPGDNETLPQKFKATPDTDLKLKVSIGEDYLRTLAKKAKRERLIGAATGTAIGVGELIWYAADSGGPTRDRSWLLYNGAIFAGISAIGFFVPRQEEEEWDAYHEWRSDTKVSFAPRAALIPTLGVPTPALVWRF